MAREVTATFKLALRRCRREDSLAAFGRALALRQGHADAAEGLRVTGN
jgi:hypothetical protein